MTLHAPIAAEPVTVETLEWCLDRVAIAIHKAGAAGQVYLPIYERFERELLELRQRQASMSSVQSRLERLALR